MRATTAWIARSRGRAAGAPLAAPCVWGCGEDRATRCYRAEFAMGFETRSASLTVSCVPSVEEIPTPHRDRAVVASRRAPRAPPSPFTKASARLCRRRLGLHQKAKR